MPSRLLTPSSNLGKIYDTRTGTWKTLWVGTQAQYDLLTPDSNTIYMIEEEA